jgi:hypothetical protein
MNQCARAAERRWRWPVHRPAPTISISSSSQVGKVVQRLHVLPPSTSAWPVSAPDGRDVVAHAELDALLGQLGVAAGDECQARRISSAATIVKPWMAATSSLA